MTTDKRRILVQLDADDHASVFDAVVAVDSDVDHLLQYRGVEPASVRDLVHGTIFTRGMDDLRSTAIFVGGSNVAAGEALLAEVVGTFFGPMRVSVMMDANGANTTAAAALVCAARHLNFAETTALILAGTGPVGQRAARLLAREGATVRLASRRIERARESCEAIERIVESARVSPCTTNTDEELSSALGDVQLVISAGAAGVQLLSTEARRNSSLQVAIDLNAVPPLGIEGVEVTDKASEHDGVICYGAIGVGGTKMKIHKSAIRRLFEDNKQVLDAESIYEIGRELG